MLIFESFQKYHSSTHCDLGHLFFSTSSSHLQCNTSKFFYTSLYLFLSAVCSSHMLTPSQHEFCALPVMVLLNKLYLLTIWNSNPTFVEISHFFPVLQSQSLSSLSLEHAGAHISLIDTILISRCLYYMFKSRTISKNDMFQTRKICIGFMRYEKRFETSKFI